MISIINNGMFVTTIDEVIGYMIAALQPCYVYLKTQYVGDNNVIVGYMIATIML